MDYYLGKTITIDTRPQIVALSQTCGACPSQWDAKTQDGRYVYIRYRWGWLTVALDGVQVFCQQHGDDLDGYLTTLEMQVLTRPALRWPEMPLPACEKVDWLGVWE